MKSLSFLLLAAPLAAFSTTPGALEYAAVQADKSSITFVSTQMGVPVNGRFPKFSAKVAFDPAKPDAGKVDISVDLASVDAGSRDANDEVVGKDWFHSRMFPTASFTASGMRSLGSGKFEVTGPLAIKGKSRPVTATYAFKHDGNNGVFDGAFTLKRIDYAVGEGPWTDVSMVANDVQVNFHIVVTAAASATVPARASQAAESR